MAVQAENLAHAIELDAADKILTNDLVALQKMLDYQKRSNDAISYLFILKGKQILAHTFLDGVPLGLIKANPGALSDNFSLKKINSTEKEHYLDIAWPIFSGKAGSSASGGFRKAVPATGNPIVVSNECRHPRYSSVCSRRNASFCQAGDPPFIHAGCGCAKNR